MCRSLHIQCRHRPRACRNLPARCPGWGTEGRHVDAGAAAAQCDLPVWHLGARFQPVRYPVRPGGAGFVGPRRGGALNDPHRASARRCSLHRSAMGCLADHAALAVESGWGKLRRCRVAWRRQGSLAAPTICPPSWGQRRAIAPRRCVAPSGLTQFWLLRTVAPACRPVRPAATKAYPPRRRRAEATRPVPPPLGPERRCAQGTGGSAFQPAPGRRRSRDPMRQRPVRPDP